MDAGLERLAQNLTGRDDTLIVGLEGTGATTEAYGDGAVAASVGPGLAGQNLTLVPSLQHVLGEQPYDDFLAAAVALSRRFRCSSECERAKNRGSSLFRLISGLIVI